MEHDKSNCRRRINKGVTPTRDDSDLSDGSSDTLVSVPYIFSPIPTPEVPVSQTKSPEPTHWTF